MRTSPARMRNLLISAFVIAATVLASACVAETEQEIDRYIRAHQAGSASGSSPYQDWVGRFLEKEAIAYIDKQQVSLRAVITEVNGDDKLGKPGPLDVLEDSLSYRGCKVSVDGRVSYFSVDSMGIKGSGYPKIPSADFERLNKLLTELPADGSHLPPAGRRMMIQVWENGQVTARVYDRANAPAKVYEILRLSLCAIRSWVPEFQPKSEWTAYPHDGPGAGVLRLSPDGRLIVSSSMNGPFKFWKSDTHKLVDEITTPNGPVTGIIYAPDPSFALIQGWGEFTLVDTMTWQSFGKLTEPWIGRTRHALSRPQFTTDGRFLLLESNEPTLKVYDTKTWEPHDRLPGIPKDAITYILPPSGGNAIYVSTDGTLKLWNTRKQKELAKLDVDVVVGRTAISPDQSLIAVVTTPRDSRGALLLKRIRIWNLKTGRLMNELRPFERNTCEEVEGLLWSPDGKYVLAATKSDGLWTSVGIGVWNAKSGRHRGEFEGCPTYVTGVALADGDHQLMAGCCDGKIRVWDVDRAFKEIAAFEKSLGEKP